MMHMLIVGAIWAIVAYYVSLGTGIPFLWSLGIVIALRLFVPRMMHGGTPGTTTAPTHGGAGHAIQSATGGVRGFVVGIAVFVLVMMIADRIIGISPVFAYTQLRILGIRPWGWPHGIQLPLILFLCVAFISA